jgi:predicted deacetylase
MIPVQYLLRVDDLCPTASRERWQVFRNLIGEFRLRPILAVVPDNRDPALAVDPPDRSFWDQMRALESAGAVIGLHGFRHLCSSRGRSILGMHRESEFAGASAQAQRAWIRDGLEILRGYGLNTRIFVAPRHGFDVNTLSALRTEGVGLLCDGFAQKPLLRGGVIWIPQQLWAPEEKRSGLWTICIHPNSASDADAAGLRAFLRVHAGEFTSVDRLLSESPSTTLTRGERIHAEAALRRFKLFRAIRRFRQVAWPRATSSE